MLSADDNELLTRIDGTAPMGRMLRKHYWVPALRAARLERDGAPVLVRLFGENFVAFRASDGRVGFFAERCPHRGVSLMLARNEDCALRCLFHGMKFDVSGKVVDVPTQNTNPEAFAKTIKLKHYPVREAGGLVWVWLDMDTAPAPFPEFEFMGLADDQYNIRIQTMHCNWVQGIEATIDPSHVGILHKNFVGKVGELQLTAENNSPRYEVKEMPYGMKALTMRSLADGTHYARITEFVFPYYSFIPPATMHTGDRLTIITVPVDDEHSMQIYVRYNIRKPIRHDDWKALADPDNFSPVQGGRANAWEQDRAAMKQNNFSGFDDLPLEDFVMQVSMGAIADRTAEQLCSGDIIIVRARRLFLQTIKAFQNGAEPTLGPDAVQPLRSIRSWSFIVDNPTRWNDPEVLASAA